MRSLLLFVFIGLPSVSVNAQIELKTEYIGSSEYKDIDNQKTGGKGGALVLSGMAQIPLYLKMDENNRPTAWGVALSGSYTDFESKHISKDLCPAEILNAQLSVTHLRPISRKWSMLASVGAGSYTAHTNLSDITMSNVLGHGALAFIWHLRDNLDVGAGVAVNTSFGYPMAFPAFYVKWRLEGRYEVNVEIMNAFEVSAGIRFNDMLRLKVMTSANGSVALEKINGKDMMFSHQYYTVGLRPELKFGKFSMLATGGISAGRTAYYQERSLKAFFKTMGREHDPHFTTSPYFSVALRYGFR